MSQDLEYAKQRHETIIENMLYLCAEVERWKRRALKAEAQVERLNAELRKQMGLRAA